ncbi:atypical kinase COQ8A, mitochondrial-like, partial [Scyliorhinus canicula]|uniref:atypical kinase COQ8A, mitochondrial-like n=1 Tax=Scyliorhinus canicula TaxID=7830 RepID=UPI0018F531FF
MAAALRWGLGGMKAQILRRGLTHRPASSVAGPRSRDNVTQSQCRYWPREFGSQTQATPPLSRTHLGQEERPSLAGGSGGRLASSRSSLLSQARWTDAQLISGLRISPPTIGSIGNNNFLRQSSTAVRTLTAEDLQRARDTKLIRLQHQTLSERARELKVPTTRLERLANFG